MRRGTFWALLGALVLVMSCEGPVGPAGPKGADGLPGTDGVSGTDGTDGTDGTNGTNGTNGATGPQGPVGDAGPAGPQGPVGPNATTLTRWDDLPGVVLAITGVAGGTGTNGNLRAGDTARVTFTVKRKDGRNVALRELTSSAIYVSGPTTNYQRVIASQSDVKTRSVDNGDGTWTYTFAAAIPTTYLAPLNDSPAFDAGYGELTGQPLLDGTYTVAMQAYQNFTIDGVTYRDTGNATSNFLFGAATTLVKREVVAQANCEQCHTQLRAHGGTRTEVGVCLTCHTAGSEDRNVSTVEGGTPGVSIDFGVMVHRIHNAAHLPSVVGVGVSSGGALDYTVASKPYKMVGYNNSVIDFSNIAFPVMPSAYAAFLYNQAGTTYVGAGGNGFMPRDTGWSALTPDAKLKSDKLRTGLVACSKCHGVPTHLDGGVAPEQGHTFATAISRKACGSCHDHINFGVSGGGHPGTQTSDATCASCHGPTETDGVAKVHLHPYDNPALNTGVNLDLQALTAGSGAAGNHQAGDPFEVTFSVKNNAGADVPVMSLTRLQIIVVGPTSNRQIILPNSNPYDFAFRKATPFTGNGTISAPTVAAGAVAQVLAVVMTGATTFDVRGSVSTPLVAQATGAPVTYDGVTFTVTPGTTPFAVDDRFYLEVVPPAATYTLRAPLDLSFELVGMATGGADVFTVGNLPLYWGRQVVMERTALVGTAGSLAMASRELQRYVVLDLGANANLAVGDRVVFDLGLPTEEYAQVGRLQTTNDETMADLGAFDRLWFSTPLRYAHAAGGSVQEVTLSTRREGTDYTVTDAATGQLTATAGRFTVGNAVVVSYRTAGRFGWRRAAGDVAQNIFPAPMADSDEVDESWGDWKGLPLLDGTYTVAMWANRDFTVTPAGTVTTTQAWNVWTNDNTTYRMMAKPAQKNFLFGGATTLQPRAVISSGDTCNTCHTDLAAHGFGRRGLDTCLVCHNVPGVEDAPKYNYSAWYVGPTPGATMDFRTVLHRVHAGKELTRPYEVNGVFLATPYPVTYDTIGFPSFKGGVSECTKCHGATNTAWKEPAPRSHPLATVPVRTWAATCSSCHDSAAAQTHFFVQSYAGQESCSVCHGPGKEFSVELSHKVR